jgi:hypothetical protein
LWHEIATKTKDSISELVDLYESLKFRHSMGKAISCNDISRFEILLAGCSGMLSDAMQDDMQYLMAKLRKGVSCNA